MRSNRLQLNGEKTEVMWCSSTSRLPQLPNSSIVVAGANVHPVSTVRDLGVYTVISVRLLLLGKPFHAVLPLFASFVISVDMSLTTVFVR